MLVARSATLSRSLLTRIRKSARSIILGSAIIYVKSSLIIWFSRKSTSSSFLQTSTASPVFLFINASRLCLSISIAFSAILGISISGLTEGLSAREIALSAIFTAWSPILSRSLFIFIIIVTVLRSSASGLYRASIFIAKLSISISILFTLSSLFITSSARIIFLSLSALTLLTIISSTEAAISRSSLLRLIISSSNFFILIPLRLKYC